MRPEDGDQALERRLTELLEATTGLVGKSVYVDLKMEDGGGAATFLADWFGPGDSEVVLQALMHMSGDDAVINTTKFIRLPAGTPPMNLRISANLMRDLKEGSINIPCKLERYVCADSIFQFDRMIRPQTAYFPHVGIDE